MVVITFRVGNPLQGRSVTKRPRYSSVVRSFAERVFDSCLRPHLFLLHVTVKMLNVMLIQSTTFGQWLWDAEIFLDMPVIWTDFESLVGSNNKICSRNNINFLSVWMKFCQSNPLVCHFSTSLGLWEIDKPHTWCTYSTRMDKSCNAALHICSFMYVVDSGFAIVSTLHLYFRDAKYLRDIHSSYFRDVKLFQRCHVIQEFKITVGYWYHKKVTRLLYSSTFL